jgi:hypothetical protein
MSSDFTLKRLARQADAQAKAESDYAAMIKQNAVTSWFEAQEMKKSNPKAEEREQSVCVAGE